MFLLVSAGFDAYAEDPITQMSLELDDFASFGKWLRQAAIPAGALLEGGYSDALPKLIDAFLGAWRPLPREKHLARLIATAISSPFGP